MVLKMWLDHKIELLQKVTWARPENKPGFGLLNVEQFTRLLKVHVSLRNHEAGACTSKPSLENLIDINIKQSVTLSEAQPNVAPNQLFMDYFHSQPNSEQKPHFLDF